MKQLINRICLVLTLGLAASAGWAQGHPGSVDFSRFAAISDDPVSVDLTLGGWLLGWAQVVARQSGDPDLEVLSHVDSVRVRVFQVSDSALARSNADEVVEGLLNQGWERLARVNDDGSWVHVLVRGQADSLEGITVIAIDDGNEGVFVNIAGRLNPADVAKLLGDTELLKVDLNLDFDA